MKQIDPEWIFENWRDVLLGFFLLIVVFVVIPTFVYRLTTFDSESKARESRYQLKEKLAKEIKEISLPARLLLTNSRVTAKDTRFSSALDTERNSVGKNLLVI